MTCRFFKFSKKDKFNDVEENQEDKKILYFNRNEIRELKRRIVQFKDKHLITLIQ